MSRLIAGGERPLTSWPWSLSFKARIAMILVTLLALGNYFPPTQTESANALTDYAVYFDGSGDFAKSTTFQIPTNNVYTVEFWYQAPDPFPSKTDGNGQRALFTVGSDVNNLYSMTGTDYRLATYMNNSAYNYGHIFSAAKTAWHHIAYVRNGAVLTLYFDGVFRASQSMPVTTAQSSGLWIAAFNDNSRFGQGTFDQFKAWDVALTEAQVAASKETYATSTGTPSSTNLIAHYDFNEGSGSTIVNRKNPGTNDLAITGNPTYQTVSGKTALTRAVTTGDAPCAQEYDLASGTGAVVATQSDTYCYVAFKNTGALNSQTSFTWTKPSGVAVADVLVVGGGGGGGSRHGGGGGAGALVEANNFLVAAASDISIVVGAGGAGANGSSTYAGTTGQTSSFKYSSNGLTALGGGFGFNGATAGSGGSGGGAGSQQTPGSVTSQAQSTFAGGALTGITFGNAGSTGARDTNDPNDLKDYWAGGGGGGAGSAGSKPTSNGVETTDYAFNTSSTARGGNGGAGRAVSWLTSAVSSTLGVGQVSSTSVYFAGGGGGGIGADGVAGGTGGVGGGANGTRVEVNGNNGLANTGGGGGGSGFDDIGPVTSPNPEGGDGGSGVVVVRYSLTPGTPSSIATSNITPNSVQVSFTAPTHTPQAITGYQYSLNGGSTWLDAVQNSSPLTITGLTSETAYSNFKIRAKSAAGVGATASVSTFTTLKNPNDYLRVYFNSTDASSYDSASTSPNVVQNLGTTTISGTVINGSNGAISLDSTTRAWNFPGGTNSTGSYIDVGDFSYSSYRSGGMTIDFEADFGSANNWERILDFGEMKDSQLGEKFNLLVARQGTSTNFEVGLWGDGSGLGTCRADNQITSGLHRWTIQLTGSSCSIWKNGSSLTVTNGSATGTSVAFGQFPDVTITKNYIGRSNWTQDEQFEGKIRYLKIFQGAFTPSEIGPVTYNLVQFNRNGGNADPASLSTSGKIRVPQLGSVTRAGYTLSGWSDGANSYAPGALFISPSGTTTLNAQWSPNTNSVSWDVNGGSTVATTSFQTGGTLSKPSDPTRSGKVFGGWSTTETSNQGDSVNLISSWPYSPAATSGITLYANWLEPCTTTQTNYVSGGRSYTVVKFSSGTNCGWYVPDNVTSIDVLAVGGGGGGGENVGTGGGGGGVYVTTSFTVSANAPARITVGEGGLGGYYHSQISTNASAADARRNGTDGTSSSFGVATTVFTAGGGSKGLTHWSDLKCGGSGEQSNVSVPGGIGGGAGGNGGVGGRAPSSSGNGSNGGAGISVDFFGTGSVIYGAGGGGGGWGGTGGLAGNGVANSGAGNGASSSGPGANGLANRGGGGGGGEVSCTSGGNGGSGLVAIRYSFASFDVQYFAGNGATGATQTASKTAGVALALASETSANTWFTKSGQRVVGWSTTDDGTVDYRFGQSYTADSAQSFYAVWANACSPTIQTFASGSSAYQVYKFTNTGYCTWTVPAGVTSIDALLVGGGGGGGGAFDSVGAGAGGGGQVISQSAISVTPSSVLSLFVGAGGQGGTAIRSPASETHGSAGKDSEIFTDTNFLIRALGGDGGSRSRADYISPARSAGTAGLGANGTTPSQGGFRAGGGGAGGNGSGLTGGSGLTTTFSGTSVTYGVGGQGGTNTVGANGASGAVNSGNGGGGASATGSSDWDGGSGGSGTVILRHSIAATTVTYNYDGADGGTRPQESLYYSGSAAVTLPAPTKTGLLLVGWYSDAGFTTFVGRAGATYTPNANITLYARWTNLLINIDATDSSSLANDSSTLTSILPGASSVSTAIRTGNAGVTTSAGVRGIALDGTSDAYVFPAGTGGVTGATTVEAWIKPGDLAEGWNIFATRWFSDQTGTNSQDWHFAIRQVSGVSKLNLYTSNGSDLYADYVFPNTSQNKWFHVAFTIDSSNNVQLYVNGKPSGPAYANAGHTNQSTALLFIGDPRAGRLGMTGMVSKFRIYNKALSSAEMLSSYNADRSTFGLVTVTLNANDGSGSPATSQQHRYSGVNTALPTNTFTKSNSVFSGWTANQDGTGSSYTDGQTVNFNSDQTLYAKWTSNYIITYNYNGATGGNTAATASFAIGGSAVTLPIPTKTNSLFDGWYVSPTFAGTKLGNTYSPSQNITLYAKWAEVRNAPSAPENVSVSSIAGDLVVTWQAPARLAGNTVTGYQVEYSSDGSNWTISSNAIAAASRSYSVTGLTVGSSYYLRVAAKYSSGLGAYGYPWTKIFETTTRQRQSGLITYTSGYGLTNGAANTYSSSPFTRIRYRMEATYGGNANYADVDFLRTLGTKASYSSTYDSIRKLQVPTITGAESQFEIQANVNDLNVESNVAGVENGNGMTGRVEIWPWNYEQNPPAEISTRTSGTYDDGDQPILTGVPAYNGIYGSFQVHRLGNVTNQTILAWNRHYDVESSVEIGFGNHGGGNSDWTFCANDAQCTNRTNFKWQAFVNIPVQVQVQQTNVITLNSNFGSQAATRSQVVNSGVSTSLIANTFTRSDFVFGGWTTNADGTGTAYSDSATISVSIDTVLYAKWLSKNANLSALTFGTGTLSPNFDSTVLNYTLSNVGTRSSVTLSPTAAVTSSTILVNGTAISSSSVSSPIPISVGSTTISIKVIAEDTVTSKSYVITVNRSGPALHGDAGFTGTAVTWSSNTYFDSYASQSGVTDTDGSATNNLIWQLYYAHEDITIPADGVNRLGLNTTNGGANEWRWWFSKASTPNQFGGFSAPIEIGYRFVSYYNAGGFNEDRATTEAVIPANTYFLIGVSDGPFFRSIKQSPNRTARANGTNVLTSMNTVFLGPWPYSTKRGIPVALGGSTLNYAYSAYPGQEYVQYDGYQSVISVKFRYTGGLSSDSSLSGLSLSSGTLSPSFATATRTYSATVAATTSTISVTATANQASASITVNSVSVNSGSASGAINLAYGSNTVSVLVTASDGSTTSYQISITRPLPVYTVSYNKNGAAGAPERSTDSYTLSTSAIVLPLVGTMAKAGYTFGGWSTIQNDATSKINGTYTPTQSVTLHAIWNAASYSYSYNVNGATSGTPSETSGTYTTGGTAITLATQGTMVRTGYTFNGWSTTANNASTKVLNSGSYTISAPVILYALWTANNYSVSYVVTGADSGNAPTDSGNYNISQSATVKANTGNLVKAGYSFAGWTINSDGSGTVYQSGSSYEFGASNVTFYPKFTPNTYTITYNTNGATGTPAGGSTTSYTTGGTAVSLANVGTMAKTGYDFSGWSTTPTGSIHSGAFTTTTNVTLYAIWVLKDISVTYNKGQISGTNLTSAEIATFPSNLTGKYGSSITLSGTVSSTVTFGGNTYQFFGWSDGNSTFRAGDRFTLTEMPPTFTAQWVRLYAVRYALNGGTGIVTVDTECTQPDNTCLANDVITLSLAPNRSGYQFMGWKDQANNSYAAGDTFTVTDSKYLLYAQWQAISYSMSFNVAGGSNTPATLSKTIGETFAMPDPGTRNGYDFAGWSDGSVLYGSGVNYNVGVGNQVFTATWTPKTYIITYDWNGGSLVTGSAVVSASYTVGNPGISLPSGLNYARDGYEFDGWSLTNGGTKLSGAFIPTGTQTLYARWIDGQYQINYNAKGGSVARNRDDVNRQATVTLPTPTRAGFTFEGWYEDAGFTRRVGAGGESHQPNASRTMFAKWTQNSLVGINPAHLNTLSTTNVTGAHTWSGNHALSGTGAALSIPNGALAAGTVVNVSFIDDLTRPRNLISNDYAYYTSVVVHWLYGSGDSATVPNTAAGKPILLTLTNPNIKVGSKVFMIVNGVATEVATATQDGQVVVEMTQDPEFVIAATKPSAPSNVVATAGDGQASISWTAPNSGGSDITGYTVTASNSGGTCTTTGATTCVISGLTNGNSYTFTVTANNAIGTSNPSSNSNSVAPAQTVYTLSFNSNGGSSVAGISFTASAAIAAPSSPSRANFTFGGWTTVLDDASTLVTFPYSPAAANITLYALWGPLVTGAQSSSNGSSGSGSGSGTGDSGSSSSDSGTVKVPQISANQSFALPADTVRQIILTGQNLELVKQVSIAGMRAQILKRSSNSLVIKLPRVAPGSYALTIDYGKNFVTEKIVQLSPASGAKVNVGSFKGYVAVFAKDYAGKRLSAKIGNSWLVLPKVPENFARAVTLTGKDVELNVRIYVDRKLVDTIFVYTH